MSADAVRTLPTYVYAMRLWRYAPAICLTHGFMWALTNLLGLAPGFIIARYFNVLNNNGGRNELTELVLLMVAIAAALAITTLAGGWAEIQMRFRTSGLVRFNLLRVLLDRPGAAPLPYPIGQTISRFRDDAYSAEDIVDWSDEIILHTIFGVAAIFALARIDLVITIAVTIPMLLVVMVTQILGTRLTRLRESSSQATSENTGTIASMFSDAPALKAAAAESNALARMDRLNQARRTAMVRDAVATKGIDAVAGSISGITTGIVMLLAAGQLRSGELSIGDFALFLIWIGFLTSLTRELGAYLTFCRQAAVAFGRMDAMLGSAPSTSLVEHIPMYLNGPPPLASFEAHANIAEFERLDIRDLTCHHVAHDGATSGINGITFTLLRGGLTVITGKIGSGKTTLVRAVLGQLPAEAGTIHWNGTKIDIPQTFMTPPRVGYVPQEPRLFSDTLRNNILLGTQSETNALEHALWETVFQDDVASFPNQLETEVGSRGLRLSGGQALRAAAARALVRRPDLLVIDDLSSALDVDTEHQLWDRLLANPERTVLAVSHRRQAFQRAHHIIVLRDGRIAAEGSLTELMHSSPDFRALWESADSEDKMDGFTPDERTSRAGE